MDERKKVMKSRECFIKHQQRLKDAYDKHIEDITDLMEDKILDTKDAHAWIASTFLLGVKVRNDLKALREAQKKDEETQTAAS